MCRKILIFSLALWLTGCVNSSTVVTGTVADAIDFNQVEVFQNISPDCDFDVIALITIPGEYYSRASLIDGFRQKAAAVGAPVIQVTYIQQTGTTGFFGSARALRCH